MTLNIDVITDQKLAPGLIENPCRDALIDLAAKVPADQAIVELGAFKGRSTGHLVLGASRGNGAHVYSVDPWDDAEPLDHDYLDLVPAHGEYRQGATQVIYEQHLKDAGITDEVTTIKARAVDAGRDYDGPKVGLLWHDALHRLEDVRDDIRAWLPHMADDAVIVAHDAGDPRFGVDAGVKAAVGRRKAWDYEGREIHLWPKQPERRGFLIVRTA